MLLLLIAAFFIFLILREINNTQKSIDGFDFSSKTYCAICLLIAVAAAWSPIKTLRFESFLSSRASLLAEGKAANVHCNTAFDAMFDNRINVIGHANPETGDIVFQISWCERLMEYLDQPTQVDSRTRYSLMLFTHEVMHIRGELNEQRTECQAIQRNHFAGELLGVPRSVARKHTLEYFHNEYPNHPYFSVDCAPQKAYDEMLSDSIW